MVDVLGEEGVGGEDRGRRRARSLGVVLVGVGEAKGDAGEARVLLLSLGEERKRCCAGEKRGKRRGGSEGMG